MSIWIVMVSYKDGITNVSQEAYQTFHEANAFVERNIQPEYKKVVNDFVTVDMDKSIIYELKTVMIKRGR